MDDGTGGRHGECGDDSPKGQSRAGSVTYQVIGVAWRRRGIEQLGARRASVDGAHKSVAARQALKICASLSLISAKQPQQTSDWLRRLKYRRSLAVF